MPGDVGRCHGESGRHGLSEPLLQLGYARFNLNITQQSGGCYLMFMVMLPTYLITNLLWLAVMIFLIAALGAGGRHVSSHVRAVDRLLQGPPPCGRSVTFRTYML